MPNEIKISVDNLFSEPYGLDDCMNLARILNNNKIDLKKDFKFKKFEIDEESDKKPKEELLYYSEKIGNEEILSFHISNDREYIGHYRFHSKNSLNILENLIKNPSIRQEFKNCLENKIVSFFKSYEWETWSYRNAEAEGAEF